MIKKLKEFLLNIVTNLFKGTVLFNTITYETLRYYLLQDLQNAFEDALERYNNIHG